MRRGLVRGAHPARPGAPFVVVLLVVVALAAACADGGPSGSDVPGVPPASPSVPPAVPPDNPPASEPAPGLVSPVPGHHTRRLRWRLVQAVGKVVVVEVQAGGAPCDAVTGIDVAESPQAVELTVWAGRTPGAHCRGVPAVLGTFRIRVLLAEPLGARPLRRG